jgi:hypothetical protein
MEYLAAATTGAAYTDTTQTKPKLTAGGSATGVWGSFTLEGIANFVDKFTPRTTSATWCTPSGQVTVAGGGTVAAQTCSTQPLGAPTEKGDLTVGAFVGWVDTTHEYWRGSLGVALAPRLIHPSSPDSISVTIEAPFYFNALNLSASSKAGETAGKDGSVSASGPSGSKDSIFKGIFRIVPALTVTSTSGSAADVQFGAVLQILGQKTLFGKALDYN